MIHQYEAVMSHPTLGWMVAFFPGSNEEEAAREADRMVREEFPEWIFTLTGEADP